MTAKRGEPKSGVKYCPRCQRIRPIAEFSGARGRAHWCRECWKKPGGVRHMNRARK